MSYAYDAMGRRISKTVQGGTPTQFLYDGANAIQETQGGTINPILVGLGIDERYARNDVTGRTYFLTDALGSTIGLTDTTGAVREQYSYDPYGNVTLSDTTTGFTNPYQFMGREADTAGLYYYRARYYSPMMAGFISEDPIGFGGGQLSFYAGFMGDPLDYGDPSGLDVTITINNRTYSSTGNSIAGTISVASNVTSTSFNGYTMENGHPPNANLPVPAGSYPASVRYDHDPNRVELQGVPYAQNVQIHNGSYPRNFIGCFGAGTSHGLDFLGGTKNAMNQINQIIQSDGTGNITVNVGPVH